MRYRLLISPDRRVGTPWGKCRNSKTSARPAPLLCFQSRHAETVSMSGAGSLEGKEDVTIEASLHLRKGRTVAPRRLMWRGIRFWPNAEKRLVDHAF